MGTLNDDQKIFLIISHLFLIRMWNVQRRVIEEIKTHIFSSVTFFRKSCRLWDSVEKYCRAGQATDDILAHAHCMLDDYGYARARTHARTHTQTHTMHSTATMVARARLCVALYIHCKSCDNRERVCLLRGTNCVFNCSSRHPLSLKS